MDLITPNVKIGMPSQTNTRKLPRLTSENGTKSSKEVLEPREFNHLALVLTCDASAREAAELPLKRQAIQKPPTFPAELAGFQNKLADFQQRISSRLTYPQKFREQVTPIQKRDVLAELHIWKQSNASSLKFASTPSRKGATKTESSVQLPCPQAELLAPKGSLFESKNGASTLPPARQRYYILPSVLLFGHPNKERIYGSHGTSRDQQKPLLGGLVCPEMPGTLKRQRLSSVRKA